MKQKENQQFEFWRGYDFPSFLRSQPSISASYGLALDLSPKQKQLMFLSDLILKITHSAYSAFVFGHDPLPALETASALSELFHHRLDDFQNYGRFVSGPKAIVSPQYDWLKAEGQTDAWEEVSLRALATFLRYLWQCDTVELYCVEQSATFRAHGSRIEADISSDANISEMLIWCRSELVAVDNSKQQIVCRQRN